MPNKTLQKRVKAIAPKQTKEMPELVVYRKQTLLPSTSLATRAMSIQVATEEDYHEADACLSLVVNKIKGNKLGLKPILDPAEQTVKATKALLKSINDPLVEAEDHLRLQMKEFKRLEYLANREATEAVTEKADELQEQALDLEEQSKNAKDPKKAQALLNKALDIQSKADEIRMQAPTGVQAESSTTRTVTVWEITDFKAVVKAVAAGHIPLDVLMPASPVINQYFKDSQDTVSEWPGFSVHPDVQIVRKAGQ